MINVHIFKEHKIILVHHKNRLMMGKKIKELFVFNQFERQQLLSLIKSLIDQC